MRLKGKYLFLDLSLRQNEMNLLLYYNAFPDPKKFISIGVCRRAYSTAVYERASRTDFTVTLSRDP